MEVQVKIFCKMHFVVKSQCYGRWPFFQNTNRIVFCMSSFITEKFFFFAKTGSMLNECIIFFYLRCNKLFLSTTGIQYIWLIQTCILTLEDQICIENFISILQVIFTSSIFFACLTHFNLFSIFASDFRQRQVKVHVCSIQKWKTGQDKIFYKLLVLGHNLMPCKYITRSLDSKKTQ